MSHSAITLYAPPCTWWRPVGSIKVAGYGTLGEQHSLTVRYAVMQVKEKVAAGQVPMAKYIITKQLTKRPEDYPDAKNQPHVQVALRRKTAGARNGVMQVRHRDRDAAPHAAWRPAIVWQRTLLQ